MLSWIKLSLSIPLNFDLRSLSVRIYAKVIIQESTLVTRFLKIWYERYLTSAI